GGARNVGVARKAEVVVRGEVQHLAPGDDRGVGGHALVDVEVRDADPHRLRHVELLAELLVGRELLDAVELGRDVVRRRCGCGRRRGRDLRLRHRAKLGAHAAELEDQVSGGVAAVDVAGEDVAVLCREDEEAGELAAGGDGREEPQLGDAERQAGASLLRGPPGGGGVKTGVGGQRGGGEGGGRVCGGGAGGRVEAGVD